MPGQRNLVASGIRLCRQSLLSVERAPLGLPLGLPLGFRCDMVQELTPRFALNTMTLHPDGASNQFIE
jgi:hypothetical protein